MIVPQGVKIFLYCPKRLTEEKSFPFTEIGIMVDTQLDLFRLSTLDAQSKKIPENGHSQLPFFITEGSSTTNRMSSPRAYISPADFLCSTIIH